MRPSGRLLVGALVCFALTATQAVATAYYFVKYNEPLPDPLDTAFVHWQAYEVHSDTEPDPAPSGFTSVSSSWFSNRGGKTPSEWHNYAKETQNQSDDHSDDEKYWGSFVATEEDGQTRFVYPGSYTWLSTTGTMGWCALACTTYEDSTKAKVSRGWYNPRGWKTYFSSRIVYGVEDEYRWDQYGRHHIEQNPPGNVESSWLGIRH
jgi:hypothetical protein